MDGKIGFVVFGMAPDGSRVGFGELKGSKIEVAGQTTIATKDGIVLVVEGKESIVMVDGATVKTGTRQEVGQDLRTILKDLAES